MFLKRVLKSSCLILGISLCCHSYGAITEKDITDDFVQMQRECFEKLNPEKKGVAKFFDAKLFYLLIQETKKYIKRKKYRNKICDTYSLHKIMRHYAYRNCKRYRLYAGTLERAIYAVLGTAKNISDLRKVHPYWKGKCLDSAMYYKLSALASRHHDDIKWDIKYVSAYITLAWDDEFFNSLNCIFKDTLEGKLNENIIIEKLRNKVALLQKRAEQLIPIIKKYLLTSTFEPITKLDPPNENVLLTSDQYAKEAERKKKEQESQQRIHEEEKLRKLEQQRRDEEERLRELKKKKEEKLRKLEQQREELCKRQKRIDEEKRLRYLKKEKERLLGLKKKKEESLRYLTREQRQLIEEGYREEEPGVFVKTIEVENNYQANYNYM